jgi:hypothetical protein
MARSTHECPWPGCGSRVAREQWGCRNHWYRLPKNLRDQIWRGWRNRQRTGDLTEHMEALHAADEWIEANASAP